MSALQTGNVAELAMVQADRRSGDIALVIPTAWNQDQVTAEDTATFADYANRIKSFMAGFRQAGLREGDRVVIMFPVSLDLYAAIAALYACGITAVMIDPGMGAKRIKWSLNTVKAKAIISVHAFLKFRFLLPPLWRISKKFSVDSQGWGIRSIEELSQEPGDAPALLPRAESDEGLITFTSGSTGKPKGANRTHGHLYAQHVGLKKSFPNFDGQVDMTCLPVVVFHNLSCGVPSILPPVDLASPASVSGKLTYDYMKRWGVTSLTGAPAFMERIASHIVSTGAPYESMQLVGVGGAPVSQKVAAVLTRAYPKATGLAVYGSTEAEPIAHGHLDDIPKLDGRGYLAGKVVDITDLQLVNLPDPVPTLDEKGIEPFTVPKGEIGEVIVRGQHVNREYINNPEANRENKLREADGSVWHRTGDLAYWYSDQLWLVGRLKDQVEQGTTILHPYPVEALIESISEIQRVAFIGSSKIEGGVLLLEPSTPEQDAQSLIEKAQLSLKDTEYRAVSIYLVKSLPVDGRHNSKIDRVNLREWLDSRLPAAPGWLHE